MNAPNTADDADDTPDLTAFPMLDRAILPTARWSELAVQRVGGLSRLTRCRDIAPLKSFNPRTHGAACQLTLSNYGGGMVQGDRLGLRLRAGAGTATLLGTQAHTRIYHNHDGRQASQVLVGEVGAGAFVAHLPDPVVAHARSRFAQAQLWRLHPTATLATLDWFVCGRTGIDERYAFAEFESAVHIVVDPRCSGDADGADPGDADGNARPVASDALRLAPDDLAPRNALVAAGFDQMLTLYLVGPRAADLRDAVTPTLAATGMSAVTALASPTTAGWIVRAMARERAALLPVLAALTATLAAPTWLGFDASRGKL